MRPFLQIKPRPSIPAVRFHSWPLIGSPRVWNWHILRGERGVLRIAMLYLKLRAPTYMHGRVLGMSSRIAFAGVSVMRSRSSTGRDWRSGVFCRGSEVVLFSTGAPRVCPVASRVTLDSLPPYQHQDLTWHCMNMCSAFPSAEGDG